MLSKKQAIFVCTTFFYKTQLSFSKISFKAKKQFILLFIFLVKNK